jgi:hypothetical protein
MTRKEGVDGADKRIGFRLDSRRRSNPTSAKR